ncbi:hypothetical protein ACVINW_005948 [Bradyrhizobium sp. USDA 4461]
MLPVTASGTLCRITLAMQGKRPPSASPIRKRSRISCQPLTTKACGIRSSAETARQMVMIRQWPTRSASLPRCDDDNRLPNAAADITSPATNVTCGASTNWAT